MTKKNGLSVKDVIGDTKRKGYRQTRIVFKTDSFSVEADIKCERLNPKKILPFEEFEQTKGGLRVIKKLVGYQRGEAKYFEAAQDPKGKWVADMEKPITEDVEKVICDSRTGKIQRKDTQKGMWFVKTAPATILNEWLIEDTYNMWAEENSDNLLKIYEYLRQNNLVGVYKFNPSGTAYNGFLVPQVVNGVHFRLLLQVARVKTNKPEISPTMTIADARAREREKDRIAKVGTASALEEI